MTNYTARVAGVAFDVRNGATQASEPLRGTE